MPPYLCGIIKAMKVIFVVITLMYIIYKMKALVLLLTNTAVRKALYFDA